MTEKVLTFYLSGSLFGIDVTKIKEINRNVEYTRVPEAVPYIVGLFNMRGQIVTLFDLARLIGLDEKNEYKKITCIIQKEPKDPDQVGFLIDIPGDAIDVEKDDCESPPANIGSIEGEYIDYVVKLKEELLIVIDPDKLLKAR